MSFEGSFEEVLIAEVGSPALSGCGPISSEELVLTLERVIDRESEVIAGNPNLVGCGRSVDCWRDFPDLW